MGRWLYDLWTDKAAFKQATRALAFGIAMAASAPGAGAEILKGDLSKVTNDQWIRFAVSVGLGMLGGGIALGEKNGLAPEEVEVVRQQLEAMKARRAAAEQKGGGV